MAANMASGRGPVVPRAERAGAHLGLVGTGITTERRGQPRQYAHHHDAPDGEQRRRPEPGAQPPGRDRDCARQHGHYLLLAWQCRRRASVAYREGAEVTWTSASPDVRGAHALRCGPAA